MAERLATLFIDENLREREALANQTNQFLEAQLEDAKRRLVEHEKKLEEYQRSHSGELPSQTEANLQAIQNAQMQLQSIAESINRDRDRRNLLERQIADLEAAEAPAAAAASPSGDGPLGGDDGAAARGGKCAADRTADPVYGGSSGHRHGQARDPRARSQGAARSRRSSVVVGRTGQAADRQREWCGAIVCVTCAPDLRELDRQIEQKQGTERSSVAGDRRLSGEGRCGADARGRADRADARLRDAPDDVHRVCWQSARTSKIAANVERQQIGEQFKILDPARVPERPFSPNRAPDQCSGRCPGPVIGVALVGLLEYRDTIVQDRRRSACACCSCRCWRWCR